MIKIRSISHSTCNSKARLNILKPEPPQKKKEPAVSVKKPNASKCTVSASPQENFVLLNAPAMAVIITRNARA